MVGVPETSTEVDRLSHRPCERTHEPRGLRVCRYQAAGLIELDGQTSQLAEK